MVRLIFFAFLIFPMNALAWEILTEREDDGSVFVVAEQVGEAGMFLSLVCFESKIHIEVEFPGTVEEGDTAELFQVDGQPERFVAGYIEKLDATTSVFVGVDRRDEPAVSTPALLREIAAGTNLYLGDPDSANAVERWSLKGSRQAIETIRSRCS